MHTVLVLHRSGGRGPENENFPYNNLTLAVWPVNSECLNYPITRHA